MNKNRLLLGVCLVVILIVAGTTSASALWKSVVSATSSVSAANLEDSCTNVTSVQNASFELPVIANYAGSPSINQTPDNQVPGWVSNPERIIEIWNQNNYLGIAPPVGNQFVELNASVAGTLSQTIPTTAGQVLQWSLLHRGRAGVDVMQVLIGAAGGTAVSQGNISDGPGAWVRYSGTYTVPAGQSSTSLSFKAISTGSGDNSIGNFLDDVSFGSGPCLDISSTVTNFTNPGTAVRPGEQVEYVTTIKNVGSSPSFQSVFTNTVPTGLNYVANSVKIGTTLANATERTDLATDGDTARVVNKAITAYLGTTASSSAGGSIAQGNQVVVRFLATPPAATAGGTGFDYTPTATYVNMLAPQWTRTIVADNTPFTVHTGSDLAVTASSPDTVNGGSAPSAATYTFTLTNLGPATATGAKMRLQLPTNLAYTPVATGTDITCTAVANVTGAQDCVVGGAAFTKDATRTVTFSRTPATTAAVGTSYTVSVTSMLTNTDPDSSNNTDSTKTTVGDTVAPSRPGQPSATTTGNTTATQNTITWGASTDNFAVTGYNIYRGTVLVGTVGGTTLTYTDNGLKPSTSYTYTVRAFDAAGNLSVASQSQTRVTEAFVNTVTYKVTAANGLCIAANGNGTTNGTTLIQANCSTNVGQNWKVSTLAAPNAAYVTFMASYSNTIGWDQDNATSRVLLWSLTPTDNQRWQIVPDDTGTMYHIVNKQGQLCLTAPNATAATQLTTTACTGNSNQSFAITGN